MLADIVRRERRARKWTQVDLARIAGLGTGTIGEIESGATTRPDRRTLEALSGALGICVDALAPELAVRSEQSTAAPAAGDGSVRGAHGESA